jgi:hypothetical protein
MGIAVLVSTDAGLAAGNDLGSRLIDAMASRSIAAS